MKASHFQEQWDEAVALEKEAVQKTTDAAREGAVTKAGNEAQIAEAEKARDMKKAQYSAEVAIETSKAEQAGPRATAVAKQDVVEAETALALKEAVRKEKNLVTEVIKPAEAEKQRIIIDAEASREQTIIGAEATARQKVVEAEGEKEQLTLQGEGTAAKTKAIGEADGYAEQKKGEGKAAGKRAELLAEAEGARMKLLAEAEGLEAKARAMAMMDEESKDLQVRLEYVRVLPQIIEQAVKPMASVREIKIMDFGGHNDDNGASGPIDKILNISPKSLAVADEIFKQTTGRSLLDITQAVRSGELPEAKE